VPCTHFLHVLPAAVASILRSPSWPAFAHRVRHAGAASGSATPPGINAEESRCSPLPALGSLGVQAARDETPALGLPGLQPSGVQTPAAAQLASDTVAGSVQQAVSAPASADSVGLQPPDCHLPPAEQLRHVLRQCEQYALRQCEQCVGRRAAHTGPSVSNMRKPVREYTRQYLRVGSLLTDLQQQYSVSEEEVLQCIGCVTSGLYTVSRRLWTACVVVGALVCTCIHCTALVCTALVCTALVCTALVCTALVCTASFMH
jgi:hypothetical protein